MPNHRARFPAILCSTGPLLCAMLVACSDTLEPVDPTPVPPQLPPVVTGVLVGPPASATIGPAGGTLALADGSASVTVPAGALSRATELTIQSITNIAPNGIGTGVRIAPETLTFAVPVTVSITYDSLATDASSAEGFGLARQDSTGAWMAMLESTVTPVARITPGEIPALRVARSARAGGGAVAANVRRAGHYVPGRLWIFQPKVATVVTNGTVAFTVLACHDETQLSLPNGAAAPMVQVCLPSIRVPTWSVNGIVRGNGTIGEVAAGAPTTAVFRAPATVPSPAEVAVSVGLYWPVAAVTKTFTAPVVITSADIRLRAEGTYVNPAIVTNDGDGAEPSAIEDRVTIELIVSDDALSLRSFTVVDNSVAAIVRDGGFRPSPYFCASSVTEGVYDYIRVSSQLPLDGELVLPGGRLGLTFIGPYTMLTAKLFISDGAGGCRTVVYPPRSDQTHDAILVLPRLNDMPTVGRSVTLDTRKNGEGWSWVVTRLASP